MGPTASLVTVSPVISLASGGPPTVTFPVYATVSPSLRALIFLPNDSSWCPAPSAARRPHRIDGYRHAGSAGAPSAWPDTRSPAPLSRPSSQASRSAGGPCTTTGGLAGSAGPIWYPRGALSAQTRQHGVSSRPVNESATRGSASATKSAGQSLGA